MRYERADARLGGRDARGPSEKMTRQKLFRIIVQICRFALAALFLFTAGAKLWIVTAFAKNVGELLTAFGLTETRLIWPATILVIAVEIITAILLLLRRTARKGALCAAALLVGFSALALYYRYGLGNAEGLECGCFGKIMASQLGVTTALRNLALLVPTAIVFFGYRHREEFAATDMRFELPSNAVVK